MCTILSIAYNDQKLWFGDCVFANYSDAIGASAVVVDTNKIYWPKTNCLFVSILSYPRTFDYGFAVRLGAVFRPTILMLMSEASPVLLISVVIGIAVVARQTYRK